MCQTIDKFPILVNHFLFYFNKTPPLKSTTLLTTAVVSVWRDCFEKLNQIDDNVRVSHFNSHDYLVLLANYNNNCIFMQKQYWRLTHCT